MQTADFDHNDFDQSAQRQLDEKLLVKFFLKTRPDKAKSAEMGRPMYKEVEYIDIKVAGSKAGGACRPARITDIERFPRHYAAFKNRTEAPVEGTPLSEWPAISRSMVETLSFMNIKTVEQLADISDTYASQIMGGHGFKQKAKDYLEYAKSVKEEADKAELKRENEELRQKMAALLDRVEALEDEKAAEWDEIETEPAPVETSQPETALDTAPEEEAVTETPEEAKRRKNREYQRNRRKKAAKKD